MTKEQLQTIADLVAIAHDEYDGCPSYRDDLERYDRVLAEIKAEAQPAPGNAAGATAPEPLSAALAETRKSLADDSWIDEITALDEDGEPDDFARRVVPLDDALEAIDRIEAAAEREHAEWHAETEAAKDDRNRIACRMRTAFSKKCRSCAANLRRVVYAVCDDCDSLLAAFHPTMGIAMKPDKEMFETMLSDVDAARDLVQHIDDHPTLTEEQNV